MKPVSVTALLIMLVACFVLEGSAQTTVQVSQSDGRRCLSALDLGRNQVAADACLSAANDFEDMAQSVKGKPQEFAALLTAEAFYWNKESVALLRAGDKTSARKAWAHGQILIKAMVLAKGCDACAASARNELRQYPAFGVLRPIRQ